MHKHIAWWVALSLLAAAAILWSRLDHTAPASRELARASTVPASTPEGLAAAPGGAAPAATATPAVARQRSADAAAPLFIEGLEATLRADEAGSLIIDDQTRSALETLIGMSAAEREQRKQRLVRELPAVAASEALDLLQRMTDYRTAATQMFPIEAAPNSVADAGAMLETVHQLRVDYLGEQIARKFFGREEKLGRILIESADKPAEDTARTATNLRAAFGMFIMPRPPSRAIGQRDP